MNQSDFDRLKEVCEKEGFEITAFSNYSEEVLVSKKKDIWEGVEFGEFVDESDDNYEIGKIYRIDPKYGISNGVVNFSYEKCRNIYHFKPSTESAYIDQLKAEALRRFGEIKEGDEFDQTAFNDHRGSFSLGSDLKFSYSKDSDNLFIGGCAIYYQGKWAARLPERVKVEFEEHDSVANYYFHAHEFTFNIHRQDGLFDPKKAGEYLAQKLEEYLNQ